MNHRISRIMGDADAQHLTELVKRLPGYLRLARQILADPEVSGRSKALLGAGGVYAVSPIDLIPGIIPLVGQLDDAYVLLYGLRKSLESMSPDLAARHLGLAGITQTDIEEDLSLVISIARRIARLVITTGARFGRAGKATYRFARANIGRWK